MGCTWPLLLENVVPCVSLQHLHALGIPCLTTELEQLLTIQIAVSHELHPHPSGLWSSQCPLAVFGRHLGRHGIVAICRGAGYHVFFASSWDGTSSDWQQLRWTPDSTLCARSLDSGATLSIW
ncbi:hypothetical protein FB567DRAFT_158268 [Paraphoma chrysanthemicola]|uniref:Uncharacterized protein n=1 Tax=Paraphoma chrysanthemicola TaxID=798071 RepID=A0A8K0W344_9PLEO|nr:hypothetical protein FB567DRAFT_158268 [Paraphoma chrysanthemicola]